jgi:4'-phosphopantetheinyl transferase
MHTRLRDLTVAERACISSSELGRLGRIGASRREQEYLCGRSLLRHALERFTGIPARSHQLARTDEGKPICLDGPAISLTHSGDLVACAVAESGEIGIDIEIPDRRRRTTDIADRYFSKEEAAWLEIQGEDRFYMLWVLKEAYLKALGCGLRGLDYLRCKVEPPRIEVSVTDDSLRALSLYGFGDAFLALAARHIPLKSVSFERWKSASQGPAPCNNFQLIAMENNFA